MKAEDFLEDNFLKQFKDGKEFMSFMVEMYNHGVEKMLEGELDSPVLSLEFASAALRIHQ